MIQTNPTPFQQMARQAAENVRMASSGRDARQLADIYLPRLEQLADPSQKIFPKLATAVMHSGKEGGEDDRSRWFVQSSLDVMAQGVPGPVGWMLANLGASLPPAYGNAPIYQRCLEAIAEHGTPAQQALARTTLKATAPIGGYAEGVAHTELKLLAKSDSQAETGGLLKEGARAAEERLSYSYDGDVVGGNQMGAVFLQAIADHGSTQEKIFASAVREGSLQESYNSAAVVQQRSAIQRLAAGVPLAYPALLEQARTPGNLEDRITLMKAAHSQAPDTTAAGFLEIGMAGLRALPYPVADEFLDLTLRTLQFGDSPQDPDQCMAHFGLKAMDLVRKSSGRSAPRGKHRDENLRKAGFEVVRWLADHAQLPENRELARQALEQTPPDKWLQRILGHSHDQEAADLYRKTLDQVEVNSRTSRLFP